MEPNTQEFNQTQTPTPPVEPVQKVEIIEPKKNSSFLLILLSILLIIASLIAGFFAYQTQNLVKEITELQISPTPITSIEPLSTNDPTANWEILYFKGCSTKNSKINYSLKVPPNTDSTKTTEDENRTVYSLTNNNLEFTINCDTAGIGAVICINGVIDLPFTLKDNLVDGCYWPEPSESGWSGKYTINDVYNEERVRIGSMVFTFNMGSKEIINQILSTFKFIEAEPTTSPQPSPLTN